MRLHSSVYFSRWRKVDSITVCLEGSKKDYSVELHNRKSLGDRSGSSRESGHQVRQKPKDLLFDVKFYAKFCRFPPPPFPPLQIRPRARMQNSHKLVGLVCPAAATSLSCWIYC